MTNAVMTGRFMKISVMLIRFYDTELRYSDPTGSYKDSLNAGRRRPRNQRECQGFEARRHPAGIDWFRPARYASVPAISVIR
jgi:hypothetical protein